MSQNNMEESAWRIGQIYRAVEGAGLAKLEELRVQFSDMAGALPLEIDPDTPGARNALQLVDEEVRCALNEDGTKVVSVLWNRHW